MCGLCLQAFCAPSLWLRAPFVCGFSLRSATGVWGRSGYGRTAKRLACWLPRPPAEQPARHVRWPTCPSLRYEQRVGLQAGDKLLCCRPQKNGEAKQGSLPAAEAPAAQERGLSAPSRSRFPLPVAVRSAARAARSTAAVGRGAAAGQARAWITTRPERRYLRPSEQHPPEEAPE